MLYHHYGGIQLGLDALDQGAESFGFSLGDAACGFVQHQHFGIHCQQAA